MNDPHLKLINQYKQFTPEAWWEEVDAQGEITSDLLECLEYETFDLWEDYENDW